MLGGFPIVRKCDRSVEFGALSKAKAAKVDLFAISCVIYIAFS